MREDLVKLQTTAKDTLICTLNERILTKQGWKTVEELILDLKSHTILNRIQLCTLRGNFPMHPCLDSVYEIGYGECYELLTDSPHPLRAENFLVGGSNEL